MGDADTQLQIQEVRTDLSNVKLQISEMRAEVRVTKHDVANVQQALNGFSTRFDKFQDSIGGKIDGLTDKLATLNVKQEKGASFYAGMAAVVTFCVSILAILIKFLAGHGA